MLVDQCGQALPFCRVNGDYQLERLRCAVLRISQGDLKRLQQAIDGPTRDWCDELVRAGFAKRLEDRNRWQTTCKSDSPPRANAVCCR